MIELTKEYINTLTEEQKAELAKDLISQGLNELYVYFLIYNTDYQDVVKTKD